MTAAIIPIARGRRCAVCGGRSTKINRFSMCTDADGRDVFVHLDCCMPIWAAWQLTTCAVCGLGDRPDDPIGIFFNGRGGDVALLLAGRCAKRPGDRLVLRRRMDV